MARLGATRHGESRLRLLRIVRRGDRHDPHDLTVSVRFEGDFANAFLEGRTAGLVPGETLKSLVHQTVGAADGADVEVLGLELCRRVLEAHTQITRVRAEVAEQPWHRLDAGGKAQGQAFAMGGPEQRTAAVTSNGVQTAVVSGIERLVLMRSAGLFPRGPGGRADDGSEDAVQGLLVGALSARWTYSNPDVTFGPCRQGVRAAILETFALHAARSIQYTLYAIGEVVLASFVDLLDISLTLHEHPYRPADLLRGAADRAEDLFVAFDEPLGVVDVTVERDRP